MYIGSPTIANCVITSNTSIDMAGGVFLHDSSATITDCAISAEINRHRHHCRQQGRVIVFAAPPTVCRFELLDGETGHRLSLHAGREATALDRNRRIVVVSNGPPEIIRRDVAHAGSLPEEASSSSHLPACIEIVQALGDSPALKGILGRPRPPGGCQSLRQLVVGQQ